MGTISDIRGAREHRSLSELLYSGRWILTANRDHHAEPHNPYSVGDELRSDDVAKRYYAKELTAQEMHDVATHFRMMGLNEHHFLFSANRHWLVMDQTAFSREIEPNMQHGYGFRR